MNHRPGFYHRHSNLRPKPSCFFCSLQSFNPMALNTGLPLSASVQCHRLHSLSIPSAELFSHALSSQGSLLPCSFVPETSWSSAPKHLIQSRSKHHWASCCTYQFLGSGCLEAFLPSGIEEDIICRMTFSTEYFQPACVS